VKNHNETMVQKIRSNRSRVNNFVRIRRGSTVDGLPATVMVKPGVVRLSNPTEISCDADWDAVPGAAAYALLVKSVADEEEAPWARHEQPAAEGSAATAPCHAELDGLEPTNTYIVRLVVVGADGADSEMSDEAFIDTLVAGCSGSKGEGSAEKKGCCAIA
jgi:hypothetical protein